MLRVCAQYHFGNLTAISLLCLISKQIAKILKNLEFRRLVDFALTNYIKIGTVVVANRTKIIFGSGKLMLSLYNRLRVIFSIFDKVKDVLCLKTQYIISTYRANITVLSIAENWMG